MNLTIIILFCNAVLSIALIFMALYHIFFSEHTVNRKVIGMASFVYALGTLEWVFSSFPIAFNYFQIHLHWLSGYYLLTWNLLVPAICFISHTDLRGGRINRDKFMVFIHMASVLVVSMILFIVLGGKETPLHGWTDLRQNLHKPDVWGRVIIFMGSLAVYFYYMFTPIFRTIRWKERKLSPHFRAYIYIVSSFPIFFILVMTGNLYAALFQKLVALLLLLYICVQYIFYEAFLTVPTSHYVEHEHASSTQMKRLEHRIIEKELISQKENYLIRKLQKLMEEDQVFRNPELSLQTLSSEAGTNRNKLSETIHEMGYSGFYEFINTHRLQYFKSLAKNYPDKSITELHEEAGFNSRATFYRFFQLHESMTPNEFMLNLKAAA